jgi:toxin ParE1/3/4
MDYKVTITRRAKADLSEIIVYISEELSAPRAAIELLDEINQCVTGLKQMPKRFALASDERLARIGIRAMPVKNYLVFYKVDEQSLAVTVVRVLYSRRDWAHLL